MCDLNGPAVVDCSGVDTKVTFTGEPPANEQDEYSYHWSYDCMDVSSVALAVAQLSGTASGQTLDLFLTRPAQGIPVECKVSLTVLNRAEVSDDCEHTVLVNGCFLDCAGVIDGTAALDECGVCNGDGASCNECEGQDIRNQQFALDGSSRSLSGIVKKGVSFFRANTGKRKAGAALLKRADSLYLDSWTAIWSISSIQLQCTNTINSCVTINNAEVLDSFTSQSTTLERLGKRIARRIKRTARSRQQQRFAKRLLKQIAAERNIIDKEIKQIPDSSQSC